MQTFDVYFLGQILPTADPGETRAAVAKLFKLEGDKAERLFSGKPLRVKQAIDAEAAGRYRATFRDAGALLQIVPSGAPPPAAATNTANRDAAPSSGDGGMQLAEPGATIDHAPRPPAAVIDTGSLEALPPNTGSLEDCQVDKPARPIPDISHLQLVDD